MSATETKIQVEEIKETTDPFASQRENGADAASPKASQLASSPKEDRRQSSDEWDASKTPPSRFQQRKCSVYAAPGSRDGHGDKDYERDAAYHRKLAEKGFGGKWKGSKGEEGK